MVEALLWGLFAAGSLVLGAVIVEIHRPSTRTVGLVMAFGAGVLLSAVSFELVEEAVNQESSKIGAVLGFFTGAIVFTLGDEAIARFGYRKRKDISADEQNAGPLAIVLGAALDGIPESAVLGLTIVQTGEVGLGMLVAVFVSNVPESLAASASLRQNGWSAGRVLGLWTVIAVVSALAAGVGFALLDGASPSAVAFTLCFAGGAILTMLATSMMPEAYEEAHRLTGLVTALGFAVAFTISQLAA